MKGKRETELSRRASDVSAGLARSLTNPPGISGSKSCPLDHLCWGGKARHCSFAAWWLPGSGEVFGLKAEALHVETANLTAFLAAKEHSLSQRGN